jgi:resuscitation-promoting factor RpfA
MGGTLALGGGSAVAASLPRPAHTASTGAAASGSRAARAAPSPSPSSSPSPPSSTARPSRRGRSHGAVSPSLAEAARPAGPTAQPGAHSSVTYTVRPGDTLSGIAQWFKLHGYGALYAANAAVIGSNPNLINPGERITITDGVMKLSHPR